MFSTFKTKLTAYVEKLLALATPVGTCIFLMSSEVPEGFLAVNGQKVYQSVHPRLYAVLYPLQQLSKGTDSTGAYVQLPNPDGKVLQATSNASLVGQLLNASLPNSTGLLNTNATHIFTASIGLACLEGNTINIGVPQFGANGVQSCTGAVSFNLARGNSIFSGSTVQPSACLSLVAIRY